MSARGCPVRPRSCASLGLGDAWPQRQANGPVTFLSGHAGGKEVTLGRGYELANQGVVVARGQQETSKNGHVAVLFPV